VLLHRHAVKAVGDLHRLFVMGDDQYLGVADGLLDETVEEPGVRVVGRRVNLFYQLPMGSSPLFVMTWAAWGDTRYLITE
jgi:hypothetical protein